MIPVMVLRTGGSYGPDYVNRLSRQLFEFTPAKTIAKPILLTNHKGAFHPIIQVLPFTEDFPGWWSKMNLFSLASTNPLLFLDLDTFIVGNLGPVLKAATDALLTHDIVMLSDLSGNGKLASGAMAWRGDGSLDFLFDLFCEKPAHYMQEFHGDQDFLQWALGRVKARVTTFQAIAPGCVVSYKWGAQFQAPADAPLVCFHGHPRPHEVKNGWAADHWKRFAA